MTPVHRRRSTAAVALCLACFLLLAGLPAPARSASTTILIIAVHYSAYSPGQADEALRVMNISAGPIDVGGWTVSDGEGTVTLAGSLPADGSLWIARNALAFAGEFGFSPAYEYDPSPDDPAVPNLPRTGTLALADDGDEVVLRDGGGQLVDSLVYEAGDPAGTGWTGPGLEPYGPTGAMPKEGQVLYRRLDQATGRPVLDTDSALDWAQTLDDNVTGKKVQYPGWDLERYFFPAAFAETASLTYAVAPDHLYETVRAAIDQATTSLYYEGYTFDNAHLAEAIVSRLDANPGMTVTLLLEGEPLGGIDDQEKWICQQIENAGGAVYFMYNDAATDVHDRYTYQHGKWLIIDEQMLLSGSENLNYSSMPADDKADGTEGNRGVWLITDAPSAVAHALDVFRHDLDPAHHRDLFRWTAADPTYGAPTPGFSPNYDSGGTRYAVRFPNPLTLEGTFSFEMVQSPENSLRDVDSLLGMVGRAGSGDTVLVEQLYEYTFWGPTDSSPAADPNLRLEAYIAAARRGARVRLLLDSVYDDPGDVRGNTATCAYANALAAAESLDLACKLANPAGTGIHNKMVLVLDGGTGHVHTGSINGSENSSKNNREFAVQVQSDAAYAFLAGVFWSDWGHVVVHLPIVVRNYSPAPPQAGIGIDALRYDASDEYVTIANQGASSQDLSGWRIHSVNGDQWYDFPAGHSLAAGASVRVHSGPDAVDNPPADLLWSRAYIWRNDGDEAVLYNQAGEVVDSLCYGDACPLSSTRGLSGLAVGTAHTRDFLVLPARP